MPSGSKCAALFTIFGKRCCIAVLKSENIYKSIREDMERRLIEMSIEREGGRERGRGREGEREREREK